MQRHFWQVLADSGERVIERIGPNPAATTAAAFQPSRRWRTLVPILLAILVLGAGFVAGIRSGLRDTIGHLFIDLSALTATLSSEYHGLTGHPYQGFLSVRSALQENGLSINKQNFPGNFRDYPTLTRALRAAKTVNTCGSPLISDPYNDQGVFDFIRGSFSIFGADVRSTYYFYFLLVGSSAGIYLLCFWRDYAACALLFACACAIYSFMLGYVLNNNQLISVSNTRFLSTLGIVPLLHVLMTLITKRVPQTDWAPLIALIAQSAIMELAIASRSTAQWMEIAFAFVLVVLFVRTGLDAIRGRFHGAFRSFLFSCGATALYVLATFAVIGSARAVLLPPSCGVAINGHPFWHNVFLGLSFDREWKAIITPELGTVTDAQGDQMVFAMAQHYAEQHHLPYQTRPSIWISTPETEASGMDSAPFGSWQIYEGIVREVFFEFVRKHPIYTLKMFFIQKPVLLIHHMRLFFSEVLGDLTLFDMLALTAMIVAIGVLAPAADEKREDGGQFGRLLLLVTCCFAISTIPLLVVYPDDFLIADQAYLVVAIVVMGLVWGIVTERSVARRRAQAANWVTAPPDVSLRC
jgi:hypothetical protein